SSPPTTLTPGNNAGNNSHSQLSSSIASCNEGGASGRKKATFLLFGKTIDASPSFSLQQSQVSSDSSRHEAFSDGFKSKVCDDVHRFFVEQGTLSHPFKVTSSLLDHQDLNVTRTIEAGNLNWPKQQASYLDRSALDNGSYHCKVFSESDDVGKTVELLSFLSYEQLYEALENMF
ncbi:hypothetical protein GOP47_0031095, partial [Adiantum capillus-veneris]